jgi:hypothetical protein
MLCSPVSRILGRRKSERVSLGVIRSRRRGTDSAEPAAIPLGKWCGSCNADRLRPEIRQTRVIRSCSQEVGRLRPQTRRHKRAVSDRPPDVLDDRLARRAPLGAGRNGRTPTATRRRGRRCVASRLNRSVAPGWARGRVRLGSRLRPTAGVAEAARLFRLNQQPAVVVARSARAAGAWLGLKSFGRWEQLFPGRCWRGVGDEPDVNVAAVVRRVDGVDAHAPAVVELL